MAFITRRHIFTSRTNKKDEKRIRKKGGREMKKFMRFPVEYSTGFPTNENIKQKRKAWNRSE
jgi:hypothetical protein